MVTLVDHIAFIQHKSSFKSFQLARVNLLKLSFGKGNILKDKIHKEIKPVLNNYVVLQLEELDEQVLKLIEQ